MNRPTLEQRFDAEGVPRRPRAQIEPGILIPAGNRGAPVDFACSDCGSTGCWVYLPVDGVLVCRCELEFYEQRRRKANRWPS